MVDERKLTLKTVDESVYVSSQLGTIEEKAHANRHKTFNKIVGMMGADKSLYKRLMTSSPKLLKLHLRILKVLRCCLVKQ
jgi:hypothetical protein